MTVHRLQAACLAVFGLAAGWLNAPAAAQVFQPTRFMLGNGMEVVLIEDHRVPMVHHMVWYKVGAADEAPGEGGIAHYLEHLMFKGTPSVPPGEFSKIVARQGGRDNAFTSSDYTGYFQTIARDRLDLVMRMESERMDRLQVREEDAKPELQVVLEERLSRVGNQPRSLFGEQMDAAQFLNHPYARPVIGWEHELKTLDLAKAMAFYRRHYGPNNAVLIVAGDVTPEELKPLAEKYYGPIARRDVPPRVRPQEPPQLAARRLVMHDSRVNQASLMRTYLAPSRTAGATEHAVPLTVLAEILNGATGRLHRQLVAGSGPAASAGAGYQSLSLDPNTFSLSATPKPGRTVADAEAALDAVVAELLRDGVTEAELVQARNVLLADAVFARDSLFTAARTFGAAITSGLSIEAVENWPQFVKAVTRDQIHAAIRHVFDSRRSVTGHLLPKEQS